MKAWQLTGAKEPLVCVDVPEPKAEPGWVVVAVKAAGLCHSDVGYLTGELIDAVGKLPITLGHEIAGTIAEVGEGVTGFEVGDRVVIPAKAEGAGTAFDGGYAAKVASPAEWVVPLPDGVSWEAAAAATDAGMTSYQAVAVAGGVSRGTVVGIIGAGGLGYLGVQSALAVGAEVYVADVSEGARESAKALGVAAVGEGIEEFTDKKLDVVVDFAGFGVTTASAIRAVKPGGRVVQVGLGVAEGTIPLLTLVMKQVELVGSLAGTNESCAAVLDLIKEGGMKPELHTIGFDEIADGLERLEKGGVSGRLVARIG